MRKDYWYDETGLTLETGAASTTYLRDPDGLLLSSSTKVTPDVAPEAPKLADMEGVASLTLAPAFHNYGRDRLGSITSMVASDGSVTNRYRYDPWGESIGSSGNAYNPFQFTGTYRDPATALY